MFHPIYNADGSLSPFRLTCLGVFVVCLLAYAVTVLIASSDNSKGKGQEESVSAEIDAAALKLRSEALSDLADGYAFLKACNSINNGFSG